MPQRVFSRSVLRVSILSNAVMYDFDDYWYGESEAINVRYSRYADDLYFSTDQPRVLSGVLDRVRTDLGPRLSPKLTINDTKTVFTSRKRRRLITGLILTADKRVSLPPLLSTHKIARLQALVLRVVRRTAKVPSGVIAYASLGAACRVANKICLRAIDY